MNNLKTTDLGGFDLKSDDLRFVSNALSDAFKGVLSPYTALASAVILSGCNHSVASGTLTMPTGYVSINGEVCFVPSHSLAISNTIDDLYWVIDVSYDPEGLKQFFDFSSHDTYEVRVAKLVDGYGNIPADGILFNTSKNIFDIINSQVNSVPSGIISMWSGSIGAIPSGYLLCDGTSGTPDLRSRFIIGYDPTNAANDAVGKTGGNDEITLSVAQMPSHNHTAVFAGNALPNHSHGIPLQNTPGGGANVSEANGTQNLTASTNGASAGTPSGTVTVNATGSGDPINIRPKFYTLAFIMKV